VKGDVLQASVGSTPRNVCKCAILSALPLPYTMYKKPTLSFPPLLDLPADPWHWPSLPFTWHHQPVPDIALPQPCVIDSLGGNPVEGETLDFDPVAAVLRFCAAPGGRAVSLPFKHIGRLTLTTPLRALPRPNGSPGEQLPAVTQLRDYTLYRDAAESLSLRSAGHAETDEGLYLFPAIDDETALNRAFVPRASFTRFTFSATASERATSAWIVDPGQLLKAVELQERKPVRQIGYSLIELGLVTQGQLERALASPSPDKPLGEAMVHAGLLSRTDLRMAIAHKMGYPMVDLTHFPIDSEAVRRVPRHLAIGFRMVPLMVASDRLIVAVDKPSRVVKLQALATFAQLRVTGVLAPRVQVLAALQRLTSNVWSGQVNDHTAAFFQTTL
jgi:hypothetical protein